MPTYLARHGDPAGSRSRSIYIDLDPCCSTYLARHGGAEEQRLSVGTDLTKYGADLGVGGVGPGVNCQVCGRVDAW